MKTIGFIGLGMIGGSVAKAIRRCHPDYRIIACDLNREILAEAAQERIIDDICENFPQDLADCDFIFLCAPVSANLQYLSDLKPLLRPECILTDVGSVKGSIHEKVKELGLDSYFIGGHPMAGSEKTGYGNSRAHLLENAYYILTPAEEVSLDKLADYTKLVTSMGAIPMVLTWEEHDYITAGVSHLPHIIASSLVNLVQNLDDSDEHMKTVAAGGFRDITRIASSSPVMWQQICLENTENISRVLDEYIRLLVQARYNIDHREGGAIFDMFARSRDYRDSIDVISHGPLKKAYMLYCDIEDEAGVIATIATTLALDNISIKNIGIIHNREFEEGVLKIEFYEEDALDQAIALLQKRNYTIYPR